MFYSNIFKYIINIGCLLIIYVSSNLFAQVNITVNTDIIERDINPLLYGGGVEYCNRGMFDNKDNENLLNAYKDLGIKYLRFPHGTTALWYFWNDYKWSWDPEYGSYTQEEIDNSNFWHRDHWFHTDDFIELCNSIGAEAVIQVNTHQIFQNWNYKQIKSSEGIDLVILNSAADYAADWVEYCNITKGYNIKYWEIGNEDWVYYSAEEYRYIFDTLAQKMKEVDPSIEIIAVGLLGEGYFSEINAVSAEDWNETLLQSNNYIDYIAPHIYQSHYNSYYSNNFTANADDFNVVSGNWDIVDYGNIGEKGYKQSNDIATNIIGNPDFLSTIYAWEYWPPPPTVLTASFITNSDFIYSGSGSLKLISLDENYDAHMYQDITPFSNQNSYTYILYAKSEQGATGSIGLRYSEEEGVEAGEVFPISNASDWKAYVTQCDLTSNAERFRVMIRKLFQGTVHIGKSLVIDNNNVTNKFIDPSFEQWAWQWQEWDPNNHVTKSLNTNQEYVYHGDKSMKLYSTSAAGDCHIYQDIPLSQLILGGNYTYILHIKTANDASGSIGLRYWDGLAEGGKFFQLINDSQWHTYAIQIPLNTNANRLRMMIRKYFTGNVYVDKAILFNNESETNLITNNPGFEDNISCWASWDPDNVLSSHHQKNTEGTSLMKLHSEAANQNVILYQDIPNWQACKGKTYTFKIRAKADESFSGSIGLKYYDGLGEYGQNFQITDTDWHNYEIKFRLSPDATDFNLVLRDWFTGNIYIGKAYLIEEPDGISFVKNLSNKGDYEISTAVINRTEAGRAGLIFRYINDLNYYSVLLDGTESLNLYKTINGQRYLISSSYCNSSLNNPCILVINADEDNLKAKAWEKGSTTPNEWNIDVNDESFTTGSFGLCTEATQALFDPLNVNPVATDNHQKYKNLLAKSYLNQKIKKQKEYINDYNPNVKIFLSEYNISGPFSGFNQDLRHSIFLSDWIGQNITDGVEQAVIHDMSNHPYWSLIGLYGLGFTNPLGFTEPLKTSTYYAFYSFSKLSGNKLVQSTVENTMSYQFSYYDHDDDIVKTEDIPWLSAFSSVDNDNRVYLTVINKDTLNDVSATISINNINPEVNAAVWTLNGSNMSSNNNINLLPNYSFKYFQNNLPVDWNFSSNKLVNTFTPNNSDYYYDGWTSFVVQARESNTEVYLKPLEGKFQWNAGEKYTFSIRAKRFSGQGSYPFSGQIIIGFEVDGQIIQNEYNDLNNTNDNDWHIYEIEYEVPQGCNSFSPFIKVIFIGDLCLDAASLKNEVKEKLSVLTNVSENLSYTFPAHSVTSFVFNDNFISNPSFENGIEDWTLWSNPTGDFTKIWNSDPNYVYEGNTSMELFSENQNAEAHVTYSIPLEKLNPGSTYLLKLWAKSDNNYSGKLGLRYWIKYNFNTEQEFVGNDITVSSNWQEYQIQITIPNNTKEFKLLLRNIFTGSVYIDKTSLGILSVN